VQRQIAVEAELADAVERRARRLQVDRVQVLVAELAAGGLEPRPARAVGLVRHRRPDHAEGDRLAVDRRLELGLQRGFPLRELPGAVADEALADEAPELPRAAVSVHGRADRPSRLQARQLGVALVDLLQVEALLEPRVVLVVLLVEVGDEAIGLLAERVELAV
jgi:hypothetical protein